MGRTWIVGALIVAHVLLAGAYSVWNPLGEAPDEADHWSYVVYLVRERQLPVGPKVTQSKHPPLYHGSAAGLTTLAQPVASWLHTHPFLRANPDISILPQANWSPNFFVHTTQEDFPWHGGALAFHLARFWSIALSAVTLAAAYGLVRTGLPHLPNVAVTVVGMLALLPEYSFISGSANNDNAAACFGTLALWGGLRLYHSGGTWRVGWWTSLALGLGLLSKVSTVMVWPIVGLAIVMGAVVIRPVDSASKQMGWVQSAWAVRRRWLLTGIAIFLPAMLIASPWLWRNWSLYGDPFGMALARQTIDLRMTPWTTGDTVWLLKGWFISFWGKFGGAGHIPMAGWIYWAMAGLTLGAGVGLLQRWRSHPTERPVLMLLLLAVVSMGIGIWQYSLTALGTDQGRLLYPVIAALATLWVLGLYTLTPPRWQPLAPALLTCGFLGLGIYGLIGVIRPAFAPPQRLSPTIVDALPSVEPIHFGELTLVGWQLDDQPILYWSAPQQPVEDWRTEVRIVAGDGTVVWTWRRSPGYGRWSTDHWPPGVVVQDAYVVQWPKWAGPGQYQVEVAVYPYDGPLVVPMQKGEPVATEEHPFYRVGEITRQE